VKLDGADRLLDDVVRAVPRGDAEAGRDRTEAPFEGFRLVTVSADETDAKESALEDAITSAL